MRYLYRSKVEKLAEALERDDTRLEASEMLRGLIDSIVLTEHDASIADQLHICREFAARQG